MADKITKVEELLASADPIELADKFLLVSTDSDGFTGTVAGTYVYAITKSGADYKVAESLYNAETGETSISDEPVIMTDGDTIFFVTRTTKEPYEFPAVSTATVQEHEVLEKQVLQAFLAFVEDRFKFGVYNAFLASDPVVYETVTTEEP